jgi:ketosteroid isomerase-like protein
MSGSSVALGSSWPPRQGGRIRFLRSRIVWQNHTGGALELQDVSYSGHEAVRQFWRDWLEPFESFEAHAEEFIDAGTKVIVPWRAAARGKASGAAVEMHRSNVYSISNGRVNRVDVFETKVEALAAAGLPE